MKRETKKRRVKKENYFNREKIKRLKRERREKEGKEKAERGD